MRNRIAPITTMTYSDYDGKDHITAVKDDLAQIQKMLESGWDILGWQNQTTIKSKKNTLWVAVLLNYLMIFQMKFNLLCFL